jgi:two-component system chemotaxis sensor kinase CheA
LIFHGFDESVSEILKVIKNIKEYQNPYQNLPILWLSSEHDHLKRSQILQAGVNDVLTIPLPNVELAARLGVHLRSQELLKQVERQSNKLKSMFDSLTLGVCEFGSDYWVEESYSKALEGLLNTKSIAGESIFYLLEKDSQWTQEEVDRLHNCLDLCLGMDMINWELNSDELPSELTKLSSGSLKQFEIEWIPLEENDQINKVMLILKDVTELQLLKIEQKEKAEEQEILSACLDCGLASIEGFVRAAQERRSNWDLVIHSKSTKELRDLHTFKGNSRVLGLRGIASLIHDIESLALENNSSEVLRTIHQWEFWEGRTKKLLSRLKLFSENTKNIQVAQLAGVVKGCFDALSSLAKEKGYEEPTLELSCSAGIVLGSKENLVRDVLQHLFTNSLAHGFENKEARLERGLSKSCTLGVACIQKGSLLEITVKDDGVGLNLGALARIAKSKGQTGLSDDDLALQILLPQVSTKEVTDDISGRGIGLNAVYEMIKEVGGDLTIELGEIKVSGHRAVSFVFSLNL